MSKGVPFDTAFRMSDLHRAAFAIIFGELDGSTFDWDAMEFPAPR